MIIELESCFNMTRDEAIAIADRDYGTNSKVYVRHCECPDCRPHQGRDWAHWYHPPWVIETTDED